MPSSGSSHSTKHHWKELLGWLYGLALLGLILYAAVDIWKDPQINPWEDVVLDFFAGGRGGNPQESYLEVQEEIY